MLRPPRRRAAAVISALTAQQYVRIDRHREWGHRLEAPAAGERKTAPEQGRQRPRSSSRAAGRTKGKGSALLNLGWHHEAVFCSRPGNCSFPRREHLFFRRAPSLPGFARHLFLLPSSLLLFSLARHRLAGLSHLRPPFLFLPAGEKETRRARCKGKRGAGVKTKPVPCFY